MPSLRRAVSPPRPLAGFPRRAGSAGLLLVTAAWGLQVALLLAFSAARFVDHDEGITLWAARLVRAGHVPYREFFHMQMPYLPYLLAPVAGWGAASLEAARLLAVACSAAGSGALATAAARLAGPRAATAALFLFGANGLTLAWHSVAKTAAVADALGMAGAAALALALARRAPPRALFVAAGAALGLAANVRLTHAALVAAACGLALTWGPVPARARVGRAALVAGAALAVSAWSLVLLARDPFAFWFGNLGLRRVWVEAGPMSLTERALTLAKFALYPQNMLVLALVALGGVLCARRVASVPSPERALYAVGVAFGGALLALYLGVTPLQVQYFGQTLPYFAVAAVPGLRAVVRYGRARWGRQAWRWAAGLTMAAYVLASIPYLVIFIGAARPKDRLYTQANVGVVLDALAACDAGPVLSFLPHYAALTRRPALTGMEVGGAHLVPLLGAREQEAARLLGPDDVRGLVEAAVPALVVVDEGFLPEAEAALPGRYRPVARVPDITLWARADVRCASSEAVRP